MLETNKMNHSSKSIFVRARESNVFKYHMRQVSSVPGESDEMLSARIA